MLTRHWYGRGPTPVNRARRGPRAPVLSCPIVKIGVVIPTLDEAESIEGAIASASVAGVEIVVADGGSRDATRERAAAAGGRVVESEPGRSRQLAVGAREVSGEAVLFLHADTRLSPEWDTAVRSALRDPEVVGGAFDFRVEPGAGAWLRRASRSMRTASFV